MPRRRRIRDDEEDDEDDLPLHMVEFAKVITTVRPHAVRQHLANEYYDLKAKVGETLECAICLEKIDCKRCLQLWTCGHSFHATCTAQCSTNRCPLCNL